MILCRHDFIMSILFLIITIMTSSIQFIKSYKKYTKLYQSAISKAILGGKYTHFISIKQNKE